MTGDGTDIADGRKSDDERKSGAGTDVADGRYTAVLDRFEETGSERGGEKLAVLLLESGEEVVAERLVPRWRLPEDARRQDAVLKLAVRNGFVTTMAYDSAATERRIESAQSRFDELAERPVEKSDGESEK
jgi:hypothetical protein